MGNNGRWPARSIDERFWSHVLHGDGCWEWQASRNPGDYGRFMVAAGRAVLAHRYAWELTHGPIPDGKHVCHRCDNPKCCNPVHLFLGDDAINHGDMAAKGRGRNQNSGKTRCHKGHDLTPENTYTHRGKRSCKTCRAASDRRFKDRRTMFIQACQKGVV